MEPATYGFIGTLIGTVVGAAASVVTTLISSWNSARLQTGADNLQRIERARTFQRDTLLKLQESLQDAMRNMGEVHHLDKTAFRETGSWHKSLLEEEINQRILSVNRDLSIITERVSNDVLRDHINEFRHQLSACMLTSSKDEADFKYNKVLDDFNSMIEHIGKVLRENY